MTKTEVMALIKQGAVHESFEHETDGIFDVTAMRALTSSEGLQIYDAPIAPIIEAILRDRVYDEQRVSELSDHSWKEDPCLAVHYRDGSDLLIDGTHRIIRRWREGLSLFPVYILSEAQIIRPSDEFQRGEERGIDWGDQVVDGKIVRRNK
jgi:hypothetical protein